jgi:transposase
MDWAKAPQKREQLVMFPTRLDEAIEPDHVVRLLDEILARIDWTGWEAEHDLTRGQPPIHPRVKAGVILYGLLTRIRSTRMLEEATRVRIDFIWLAEGRKLDHTTISTFRTGNAERLKDLFVQVGLVAREMKWLTLETLAFDGTRIRANNRRSGTRTPERLREMKAELAAKYAELEQKIADADVRDEEAFGDSSPSQLDKELADTERRRKKVDAALAEIERMEQDEQKLPNRLPITDPQCRVTPNKDGGYAPNYTPLATVDVDSGLIVSADVIPHTDEDKHLMPAVEDVQESFGLDNPPAEMLADGMMATGDNLAACDKKNITLYSPIDDGPADNPALRDDPTVPVPAEDRGRLPTKTVKSQGKQVERLDKHAFVYDEQNDCYWCPEGKRLSFVSTNQETHNGRERVRHKYQSDAADCDECPLRAMCLSKRRRRRDVRHEQHEPHSLRQRERMRTEEAQQKYARRRHPGERPFAVIKQQFAARQFLTRGIERVKQEWLWLATAFNLKQLFGLFRSGADPPGASCETM